MEMMKKMMANVKTMKKCLSVLMTAVSDTGLMKVLSGMAFGSFSSSPAWLFPVLISLCICVMRAFIPTTTAVIALFAPMLLALSAQTGMNESHLLLMLSFWAASALLLVFTEPIYLIAYKIDYFTATDLLKAGALPSLALAVTAGPMIAILARLAGI